MKPKHFQTLLLFSLFFIAPCLLLAKEPALEELTALKLEQEKLSDTLKQQAEQLNRITVLLEEQEKTRNLLRESDEKFVNAKHEGLSNRIADLYTVTGISLAIIALIASVFGFNINHRFRKFKASCNKAFQDFKASSHLMLEEGRESVEQIKEHEKTAREFKERMIQREPKNFVQATENIFEFIESPEAKELTGSEYSFILATLVGKYNPFAESNALELKRQKDGTAGKQNQKEFIEERIKRFQKLSSIAAKMQIPLPASHYFNIAYDLNDVGRFDEAISQYSIAISLKQDYVDAYNNRGLLYAGQNETKKALADYNKALELEPYYAFYYNRGLLYAGQNETEKALADFNKVIELEPDYAKAYTNLAECQITLFRFTDAATTLKKNPIAFSETHDSVIRLYLLRLALTGEGKDTRIYDEQYRETLHQNEGFVLENWGFGVIDSFIEKTTATNALLEDRLAAMKSIHDEFKSLAQ